MVNPATPVYLGLNRARYDVSPFLRNCNRITTWWAFNAFAALLRAMRKSLRLQTGAHAAQRSTAAIFEAAVAMGAMHGHGLLFVGPYSLLRLANCLQEHRAWDG